MTYLTKQPSFNKVNHHGSKSTFTNQIEVTIMAEDGVMPQSNVYTTDFELSINDADTIAMLRAEGKKKCLIILNKHAEKIAYFKQRRIDLRVSTEKEVAIFLLNINDINGRQLSKILMPGYNWDEVRKRGETPIIQGLIQKSGIQKILESFDMEASIKLQSMTDVAIVVIDHYVIEIFEGLNLTLHKDSL